MISLLARDSACFLFLLDLSISIFRIDLIMITEESFIKEITRFHSISDKLSDQWQLHQPDKTAYQQTPWLSKRQTKLIQTTTSESPITQIPSEDICEVITQPSQYINGDYHVIFSHVYNVPMLFFNLSHSNGAKLKLDEVWELSRYTVGDTDRWSFLTEDEHPILCIPYFCLHPCNTGRFMERLLTLKSSSYLLMWLSVVSAVVKLDVPLVEYSKHYTL